MSSKMEPSGTQIEFDEGRGVDEILDETKRYLLENKKTLIRIRVFGISDPKTMLESGFIVSYTLIGDSGNELVARYVDKLSEEEMKFWYISSFYFRPAKDEKYVYANIEGWKQYAQEKAYSLPLFLFAPDLLYQSNRPVTNMSMFRQPTSVLYTNTPTPTDAPAGSSSSELSRGIVTTSGDIIQGIPVTRYASGMQVGLYNHDDANEEDFCGTFYYYEPESTTYLTYSTFRVYRNKSKAVIELYKEFGVKLPHDINESFFNTKVPDDLRMTPLEYAKFFHEEYHDDYYPSVRGYASMTEHAKALPDRKYYMGYNSGGYAEEDIYDQDICKVAALHGINIVIFTHMIGSHQVVTEVLDTRERLSSFDNLAYYVS